MALPKVSPGQYNYGAYANPKQVKIADTSAIGKGIEKGVASAAKGFVDKTKTELSQAERRRKEERDDAAEQRRFGQQEKMTRLSSDLTEGRQIRKEGREAQKAFDSEYQQTLELAMKIDQLAAKDLTQGNSIKVAESIERIKADKSLSRTEQLAQLNIAEENFEEYIETNNLIKGVIGNKALTDVPTSEILSEQGKMLKGLAMSAENDIVAFSDYDATGLGAEFKFTYETGNLNSDGTPERKQVAMTGYEIKNLIRNADKNFEVKHVFGTQEDIAAVNEFMNIYDKSAIKFDPLYYGPEGKLNEEEYINMLMNDQRVVSQVAGTKSAASLYKTLTNGEEYEPNNTRHRETVARYYAETAMQSIKVQNPGIFDEMPKQKTETEALGIEDYKGLNQSEKKTELTKELKRRAATGDISILKGYEKFKGLLWDGEKYVDKEDDEIIFYPSEIVEEFIDGSKTWQADSELGIFSKTKDDASKYDQFIINE